MSDLDEFAADRAGQEWDLERDLACDQNKKPIKNYLNCLEVLTRHPAWRGVIGYDEFSGRIIKRKPAPYGEAVGEWTDFDDLRTLGWIAKHCRFEPKKQTLIDAIMAAADANRFHEVRHWLESLAWDKTARVNSWLIEYLGAGEFYDKGDSDDEKHRKDLTNQYVMEIGRLWLLAAVARIMRPGCKADNVLILEGEQAIGKSSALAVLGGAWFSDAHLRVGDKDALQAIRGKWIIELSELDSFNRAEASAIKAFFSISIDRYRASYGHRVADVPRQCVFAGTVNHETYLKDETGNRRFWPVTCRGADLARLAADREQLFAEAVFRYKQGEAWEPQPAQRELFELEQEARYVGDAWEPVIKRWLDNMTSPAVKIEEILGECLEIERSRWTRQEAQRVGAIMRRLKWKRKRSSARGRSWFYQRPEHEPATVTVIKAGAASK